MTSLGSLLQDVPGSVRGSVVDDYDLFLDTVEWDRQYLIKQLLDRVTFVVSGNYDRELQGIFSSVLRSAPGAKIHWSTPRCWTTSYR